MRTLFVGADVGGCRALEPVLEEMRRRGGEALVADHGFWKGKDEGNQAEDEVLRTVASGGVDVLAFSTSVKDVFPLTVARLCRERGIPSLCMLDSWVNYRSRLEIDGKGLFIPDVYALMDDEAFDEALRVGFPADVLAITGQPAFSSLEQSARVSRQDGRKTVLFVSEPVEMDQGGKDSFPEYRGYTEKEVLPLFCQAAQPLADELFLLIAPHPREDGSALERLWREHRGCLEGRILAAGEGREAAFSSFGVAGMASVLLYESWLLGLPVLSLQPGVRRRDLGFILRRDGVFGAESAGDIPTATAAWAAALHRDRAPARQELERHRSAAIRCVELLESLYARKIGG